MNSATLSTAGRIRFPHQTLIPHRHNHTDAISSLLSHKKNNINEKRQELKHQPVFDYFVCGVHSIVLVLVDVRARCFHSITFTFYFQIVNSDVCLTKNAQIVIQNMC